MTENRKHQRFELKLPFQVLRTSEKAGVTGETKNVSSSGVLFSSTSPVPVGEAIEYFITFPRTPGAQAEVRLRCVGKVLREEPGDSVFAASLDRYEFLREPAERR